jgi:CcmD family protein
MNRLKLALASALTTVTVACLPVLAHAQEFEKVTGKVVDEVPAGPFVGIAYGFIWIAILGYVLFVARGLARVRGDIADLRRKLDGKS